MRSQSQSQSPNETSTPVTHVPLGQMSLTRAQRVVRRIVHREGNSVTTVNVAAFGSFI